MAKKQFKAESKKLLDLMINSIYTNKEIFLRELISNASDALDKRHFISLTDKDNKNSTVYEINLAIDKDQRALIITDTGIGMNKEDLENNLGTIAKSGSELFKKENEGEDLDIIGQFGVGFYSAFMVSKKIVVETTKLNENQGYRWSSQGVDGYTIEEIDRDKIGSTITLYLKDDTDDINYSEYLDNYKLKTLIKKYSDYIRYPIHMDVEVSKLKEGSENEYEKVIENQTLNSMIPLWKRNKKDITKEEYEAFYSSKFYDYTAPSKVIHYSVEGNLSYNALLFIPGKTPFNFYSPDYQAGIQLYSKGVFIVDKAKDIVPDYFKFVNGIIDSDDVSLNISRELLQQDTQLKSISKNVTNKVKATLVDMLVKEREEYEKFFENFGMQLKNGIYTSYGVNKNELQDLIIFRSSKEDKYVTFKEYVERMPEGQKEIYYACGDSLDIIKKLPQLEKVLSKGYEVLYFLDRVDEFMAKMMNDYNEKPFKNISQGDLDLDSQDEKDEKEKLQKDNTDLLGKIKELLKDEVSDVVLSSHLTNYPVCLTAGNEGISFEMEKTLSQLPESNGGKMKATKILEINPNTDLFKTLQKVFTDNPDKLSDYSNLLYQQALLIEGFPISDPVEYSRLVCQMMVDANK